MEAILPLIELGLTSWIQTNNTCLRSSYYSHSPWFSGRLKKQEDQEWNPGKE